jgi:tRNA modification GTPase
VDFSKIKTKNIAKANFNSLEGGSIEPLVISGPMGPLLDFGSIGPIKKSSGPIEPNLKNLGPIEPDFAKTGPIEPVEKSVFPMKNEKEGSPDSKNSAQVLKSGSIEPSSKNSGPIEPKLEKSSTNLESGPIGPINGSITNLGPIGAIEPVLKSHIIKKFDISTANNPILLERHRDVINKIYSKSVEFDNNINGLTDVAILSSEVNILGHSLTELIGIVSPDDVLNSIFANFCIGK